jgi:methionyl aminopeptidase
VDAYSTSVLAALRPEEIRQDEASMGRKFKGVILRSSREIAMMRKAGLLVWQAHRLAESLIRPGMTTAEIDAAVEQFFREHNAAPLFKNYPNPDSGGPPFPAVTCISINEEVVHGIPGPRRLVEGEIVSIDTGCKLNGWCCDAAATYPVGRLEPEVQRLLDVTRGVLDLAIERIGQSMRNWKGKRDRKGKTVWPRWRGVAGEMQRYVNLRGFSVVEQFVGHGIGKEMHEDPQVPNFASNRLTGRDNFELRPGLVIAVEPMVNMGTERVRVLPDRWTQVTADGRPSAHFEHTIAVTESGAYVLTAGPDEQEDKLA